MLLKFLRFPAAFIGCPCTRGLAPSLLAFAVAAGMAVEAGTQELPAPRATRRQAAGTYQGTRKGQRVEQTYSGDLVEEETDCALTMRFHPGGGMTFDAGRYFYQQRYGKRTTNGGYLKAVTTIESAGGHGERSSRLYLNITEYGRIWGATWQPRVEIPGTVTLETWLTDSQGRVLQRTTKSRTTKLVYCDPYVVWRGADGRGEGLPLSGHVHGPDTRPGAFWITIDASWRLQVPR